MSDFKKLDVNDIKSPLKVVSGSTKCPHSRTEIDDRLRILTCEACKEKIDPIQYLIEVAHRERRWMFSPEQRAELEWMYRRLVNEIEEKKTEKARLQREIRKLRGELQSEMDAAPQVSANGS